MDICILEKLSMTSIEIAELVGSQHSDVKRSIERMVAR
ncbi:DNA-binding protein, partial [Escherichia coli]|nr:DNA-binding protein [Escherichia coli]